MRPLSRVVWSEGMHLAQHHFQVQNSYFENSINFAISQLFFKSYGTIGLELDAEALRNGTVHLLHARGVMPDGLAYHFPEADPPPAKREIRDLFSPTQDSHLVLLAIPPHRPGQPNCVLEPGGNGRGVRYRAETQRVMDETTGRDEKAIDLGRKNFRLLLDAELGEDEDLVTMPLARVLRDGTGHFIYDPDYVPPCLQIGASPKLMNLLGRLIEILEAKSGAMATEQRGDHRSIADFAAHEVASFWLLHTIHSSLAPLRHQLAVKRTHPERLYIELARLAGALCTFSLDAHPQQVPLYEHDRLTECFNALDQHIRRHLDVIIPKNCLSIRIEREREYLHTASLTDKRVFGPSEWVLAVRSSADEAETISRVPSLVKVCSAKHIARLVKEAYPGLPLEHVASPPPAVSPRIGDHYFRITKTGPCWESIQQSEQIGIYVPAAIPDVELELLVVLEGRDAADG